MSSAAIPLPTIAEEEHGTSRRLAQLRLENDALVTKLAQLAGVMRGLVRDLAVARRDARRKQQQLEALRIENDRLRAQVPSCLRPAA